MSHEIETFEDGSAAFFSARELPWHRLGVVTENVLTAEEAIKAAQQDWLVEKMPIFTRLEDGTELPIADKFATVRQHAKKGAGVLGVVGSQYVPVQNHEAFEVLDLIRDDSGAVYETAGSLYDGRRVFITMKLPNTLVFDGKGAEDKIDLYLLAMNSHDSSTSFTLAITPVRVVCRNTLAMALNGKRRMVNLKHTSNVKNRVTEARDALGLTFAYMEEFETQIQKLIKTEMSNSEFQKFIEKMYPINEDSSKQVIRQEQVHQTLKELWNAPTQDNIKGTRWAAYNSVVEYVDYAMGVRLTGKRGKSNDANIVRAVRTMTGAADDRKNKAFQLLVK